MVSTVTIGIIMMVGLIILLFKLFGKGAVFIIDPEYSIEEISQPEVQLDT